MATSISYSSTSQQGKSLSKAVSDVNPTISDSKIKTFTQKLNALTTNTLGNISRIDKNSIDTGITYYDITIEKDNDISEGTHIIWDAANPTKISVQDFSDAHEYLTLILKVNNQKLCLDSGIPYIVERHATQIDTTGNNNFTVIVSNADPYGICFDFLGGIDGYITVTIPQGKATIGSFVYYYNSVTFTIQGTSA